MATVRCAASQSVTAGSPLSSSSWTTSSTMLKSATTLAVPSTQAQNGYLKVRASSSEELHFSRREAMTVAGGAGLAGLLLLVPVGSAEARTPKLEVRKKIREELDKLKEGVAKAPEVIKENVAKLPKK